MQHGDASDYQPPSEWRDGFLTDPDRGVARLVGGFVRLPRAALLGPSEAARILFGRLPQSDPLFVAFDNALARWLDARHEAPGPTSGAQLNRWLGETLEALAIAGALQPPVTAKLLRTRFIRWRGWVEQHFFFGRPDARLAYFDALARTQHLAAEAGLEPFGLEPLWLQLCGQCGGKYPQSYLSTALLGLRLLPERSGAPSERPWVTGIGTWALAQSPSAMDFAREWGALKRIYALTPGAWQTAVAQTLDRPPFRRLRADLRELWEKDVGLDRRSQYKKSKYYLSEPAQEAVTTLETRMNEPLSSIEKEIRSVVAERERHARATGDAYPLVFAASKLGLELLKRNWAASEVRRRGEVSIWLASLAIKWDPNNPMGWVVWRDALAAAGDQDMAERIGWAAIKRFPEDLKMRNQLARLLARNTQRQGEAEALLLETISRFPRDEYCRNQLAHLLVDNRRWTEAEIVLRKAHEELGSAVAANQLADLISRRGRSGQAEQLLRDTIAQAPHSSDEVYIHSRNILARLMSHDPSRDEETVRELLETIELSQTTQGSARNQLAFILSRAGKREEARKILDETLRLPMMTLKDRTTAQAYLKALSTGDLPEAEEFWAEAEEAGAGAQPERGEDSAPDDKMDYLAAAGAVLSDFLEPGDARERALETGQDPESQRESAAEPPPEKRSGARSESESESEKTAPSPDRGDGVPPASASKPAAAAHGAGETPRQGVVESRLPESAPPLHVQMAAVAGRQGELRRLTTLVMRKKGQERQRMAEALMRDAPGDLEPTYQEFVRRWVFGMETDRPTPDTFTISFIDALRRGNVDKLGELQNSHRSFRQLTDMARAVLIQDKEAAERTFSWLKRSDVAESRAVVALRKLTMLRLSEPPADADDMLKALAQNDNVIADLEEAALAEADMLLAA